MVNNGVELKCYRIRMDGNILWWEEDFRDLSNHCMSTNYKGQTINESKYLLYGKLAISEGERDWYLVVERGGAFEGGGDLRNRR